MGVMPRYIHSSLYAFDADARATVIRHFNSAFDDSLAFTCVYDHEHNAFIAECPPGRGPEADDALCSAIARLTNDDGATGLQRFCECEFDNIDTFALDTPRNDALASAGEPSVPSTHFVIADSGGGGMPLKLFFFHELPARLLERALAPNTERSQASFSKGLTARAVRWTADDGFVFNGRTGEGDVSGSDNTRALEIPNFPQLHDLRAPTDVAEGLPAKSWEFVAEEPTIAQWLAGVGETRPVEPDQRAETPPDALGFLAQQSRGISGRVRVAKVTYNLPDEHEANVLASHDQQTVPSFNTLLRSGSVARPMDYDETINHPSDDTSHVSSESETPANFHNLLTTDGISNLPVPPKTQTSLETGGAILSSTHNEQSSNINSVPDAHSEIMPLDHMDAPQRSSASAQQAQVQAMEGLFPSYGRSFANVDTVGLHASARYTAEWEDARHLERQIRKRRLPVKPRCSASSVVAEAQSLTASSGRHRDDFAETPQSRSPGIIVPQEATWANTTVEPDSSRGGHLIDDSQYVSDRPVQFSPGLRPSEQETIMLQHNATNASTGNLIDPSEGVPPISTSHMAIPGPCATTPLKLISTEQHTNILPPSEGLEPNDRPVERLTVIPAGLHKTKDTMRQKAASKKYNKQNKFKQVTPNAELPKPEPIQLRKAKKAEIPAQHSPAQAQQSRVGVKLSAVQKDQVSSNTAALPRITEPHYPFGTLLHKEQHMSDNEDNEVPATAEPNARQKLVAQIGTLLLRLKDSDFDRETLDQQLLEKKLNETSTAARVDFLTRLTTSDAEAGIILDLAAPYSNARKLETVHDLYVRDTDMRLFKVRVPGSSKMEYTVTPIKRATAEAYLHFPTRVYDAQFQLFPINGTEHISHLDESIKGFVMSMVSEGQSAAFRAFLQSKDFTVEQILARQIISVEVSERVSVELSKNWELSIELVDSSMHNFHAVVMFEEAMQAEQRVWWDLSYETKDLKSAGLLEQQVRHVVSGIDSVGLHNEGPWIEDPMSVAETMVPNEEDSLW